MLTTWTIYRNPSDFPGKWVVRMSEIVPGTPAPMPRPECAVCETLDQARAAVPPGLFCLPRFPADDPVIYEVWI
jgi:hypothetical protein